MPSNGIQFALQGRLLLKNSRKLQKKFAVQYLPSKNFIKPTPVFLAGQGGGAYPGRLHGLLQLNLFADFCLLKECLSLTW